MKQILIIEDDDDTALMMAEVLAQETPYQTMRARTGQEALHLAQRVKPDLYVIDCTLRGEDGIDLYDQLHALEGREAIPAIFYTASYEQHAERIQARQMNGLSKPFEIADLLALIERVLNDPSA